MDKIKEILIFNANQNLFTIDDTKKKNPLQGIDIDSEIELIRAKKSKLSAVQRRLVVSAYNYNIKKGNG